MKQVLILSSHPLHSSPHSDALEFKDNLSLLGEELPAKTQRKKKLNNQGMIWALVE